MRIHFFFFLLFIISTTMSAQTPGFQLLDLDNSSITAPNGTTFTLTVTSGGSSIRHFSVNSTSTVTQNVIVKRYIHFLNSISATNQAIAPFSFNNINFPPSTFSASASAGVGQSIQFDANLYEATIAGYSEVHYKFMDASDTLKAVNLLFKYNVALASVPLNSPEVKDVTVFPNPCENGMIHLSNSKEIIITLLDAKGLEVKKVILHSGEDLSVKEVPQGMYLLKLSDNEGESYKKILIRPQ